MTSLAVTIALVAGAGLVSLGVGYLIGYRFGWGDAREQLDEVERLEYARLKAIGREPWGGA